MATVFLSVPAYVVLFFIHWRHSLPPLIAGGAPSDLGYGADASPTLQLLQITTLLYLFAVYGLTLRRWTAQRMSRAALLACVATLGVMAWTLLPANSTDVLDYLGFGRLLGVHHLNPYTHTFSEVDDEFSSYVTWDYPLPYGPVLLPIFTVVATLFARHVVMAIYAIKTIWLAIHFLNVWLVYRLAALMSVEPARAVFIFAANPLLLFEQVGNAHNDGVLVLFCLLAVWAIHRRRALAALALGLTAGFVKAPGVFWLVGIGVLLMRQRQWRALTWGCVIASTAALVMWRVFADAGAMASLFVPRWPYSEDSLHTLLITAAEHWKPSWNYDDIFAADRAIALVPFFAAGAWRLLRIRDVDSLIREIAYVLLLLLLGYWPSFYPWYISWLLPLAAMSDDTRVRRAVLLFSLSAIALYAFPFGLVEYGPRHYVFAALRLLIAFVPPIAVATGHGGRRAAAAPAVDRSTPVSFQPS